MRIITIVRTLNEERNIGSFCRAYNFSDLILVADGGSSDRTIELAEQFDYVEVRPFTERVELGNGRFYNHEPKHLNFLLDWAMDLQPDWIVYDDCDSRPGKTLQAKARHLLTATAEDAVFVHRVYLWGQDQYFPKLTTGGGCWAWRPAVHDIHVDDSQYPNFFDARVPMPEQGLFLDYPPYALIHDYHPERERSMHARLAKYEAWGHPQTPIIISEYAPPVELPDWIKNEL